MDIWIYQNRAIRQYQADTTRIFNSHETHSVIIILNTYERDLL